MNEKEITLTRTRYEADRTLGSLVVSEGPIQLFRCATLCLPWADNRPRVSCSPAGRYRFTVYDSPSRRRKVLLLHDVPGRSMIEVHNGNWPKDSLGCEIIGLTHADIDGDGKMDVQSSVVALDRLLAALGTQTSGWITIVGDGRDTLMPGMNGYPKLTPDTPPPMTRTYIHLAALVLIAASLISCSAEKRLNKLLALHPELHDTLVVHDTVRTVINGVQHDTTFLPVPADTVRIDDGRLHVRYVQLAGDTVWLQGRCDADTVVSIIEHTVDRVGPTRTVTKEHVPWWVYVLCGGLLLATILSLSRK